MLISLFKNFFTYSIGAIIARALTATIAFISLNLLTPEEFGLLALINTFIGIIPIFFNLGLRQAFWLEFFHNDIGGQKIIINEIIIIYLCFATPIFFLSCLNIKFINNFIFVNQATSELIFIALLICFLHFFNELFFQVFRYREQANKLAKIQISMSVINILFVFLLVRFMKFKIEGIVYANLISYLFIFFYALYLYFQKIKFIKIDIVKNRTKIFYYFKTGLPFIPSIIFSWLLSFADRWMLVYYKSIFEVGVYSVADSFAQLFNLIITVPFISAYQPMILKKFKIDENAIYKNNKHNLKIMSYIMLICFIAMISLFYFFKILFMFAIPTKYHVSIDYILILLIGQLFYLGAQFAICLPVYLKKSKFLMVAMIFSALINLFLNFILIKKFSLFGCSIATLLSYVFYFILVLCFNFIKQ